MKFGALRELGDIEQDSAAANASQPDYSGTAFMRNVPSSIASTSGSETFRGRQLTAETSHVVELNRIPGIKPDMRYRVTGGVYKDCVLHIRAVRDMTAEGIPHRMQLDCTQLTDVG